MYYICPFTLIEVLYKKSKPHQESQDQKRFILSKNHRLKVYCFKYLEPTQVYHTILAFSIYFKAKTDYRNIQNLFELLPNISGIEMLLCFNFLRFGFNRICYFSQRYVFGLENSRRWYSQYCVRYQIVNKVKPLIKNHD